MFANFLRGVAGILGVGAGFIVVIAFGFAVFGLGVPAINHYRAEWFPRENVATTVAPGTFTPYADPRQGPQRPSRSERGYRQREPQNVNDAVNGPEGGSLGDRFLGTEREFTRDLPDCSGEPEYGQGDMYRRCRRGQWLLQQRLNRQTNQMEYRECLVNPQTGELTTNCREGRPPQ